MFVVSQDGETALYRAALWDRVEVVKILVSYGAAVGIRDKVANRGYV